MGSLSESKLQELVKTITSVEKTSLASDLDRRLLLAEAQKLVTRLQTPLETTTQICHTNTFVMAAMKGLVEISLFDKWEKDGGKPKTAKELAQLTGAEPPLLDRLLRVVTTSGLLSTSGKNSNGEDVFEFTDFARGTASGRLWHYWYYHTVVLNHTTMALPEYLKTNSFKEPTNAADCPWATYMGKPIMDWAVANPQAFTHLNQVMSFKSQDMVPWFTVYPAEQLFDGTEGTVIVDIGGGSGRDMIEFEKKFSSKLKPGQAVLQDLAQPIEEAGQLPPAIHKEVYDFFAEQPVKGARAYFMHNVLHDWSEEECLKILARVKEAMKPGYSRVLINENVLSLESTPFATATDMTMMILNAGAERTADQWRSMLDKAGLKIVKIHVKSGVDEGIIEAEI